MTHNEGLCCPEHAHAVARLRETLQEIVKGEFDDLDPDDGLHRRSARKSARLALEYFHEVDLLVEIREEREVKMDWPNG